MSEISRSQFLGIGASLAAGLSAGCVADGASPPGALEGDLAPDLVLVNGRVLTQDDDLPTSEAFATKGGRFLAVGNTRDVSNLIAQGRTSVIDAAGMTVLPGFIDSHSHPSGVGCLSPAFPSKEKETSGGYCQIKLIFARSDVLGRRKTAEYRELSALLSTR